MVNLIVNKLFGDKLNRLKQRKYYIQIMRYITLYIRCQCRFSDFQNSIKFQKYILYFSIP